MSNSESHHTDPTMQALEQANPVPAANTPSAQTDAAQAILSEIISRPTGSGFDAYVAPERTAIKPKSVNSGRYRYLAAVAVALAVVAAGVSFLLPNNSEPALAALQNAAAQTRQAESGRMAVNLSVTGSDDGGTESLEAELEFAFNQDGDLSLTIPTPPQFGGEIEAEVPGEFRIVDGTVYFQEAEGWVGFEAGNLLEDVLGDYANPTKVLDEVQSLTDATRVGDADVDGVKTTQYRAEINLADGEAFNARGWLGELAAGVAVDANGVVVIDFFVGNDGLMRQMDISADLAEAGSSELGGQAQAFVSTKFTDLNTDIVIEAPEDAEVMSLEGAFDN